MSRPERLSSNALGAGLNDGWTVGAASRFAVVALVEVFIRASDAGPATFTRYLVSHTAEAPPTKCVNPWSGVGKPQPDLALGRLGRIGAMHQVELHLKAEIAPDGAWRGTLDRVGCAGQLPHRRDRPGSLHDRRHQRSRRDELQ